MKLVTVATQKGGSGKTTLCLLLANALHFQDGVKVCMIDADFQQSVVRLRDFEASEAGEEAYPVVTYEQGEDYERLLNSLEEYDVVIVDTPGRMDGFDVQMIVAVSDYVLVPLVAKVLDMESTAAFFESLNHMKANLGANFEALAVVNKYRRTVENMNIEDFAEGFPDIGFFDSKVKDKAIYGRLTTVSDVVRNRHEDFNAFYREFKQRIGL